jgi:hypothetical protein
MNYHNEVNSTNIDMTDLPKYDEEYHTETKHQLALSVYVRNLELLSDEKYNEYLNNLKSIVQVHDYDTLDHIRVYHDKEVCPADDVDPFTMKGSMSFTQALGIEDPAKEMRKKPEADEFNDFYNLDPNDLDGFGPSGIDNNTREL